MGTYHKSQQKLTAAAISAAMLASTITMSLPALKAEAKTTVTQPTKSIKQTDTSKLGRFKSEKAVIYKSPAKKNRNNCGQQKT